MSPKDSLHRSKKYPNLYKYPSRSPKWIFRKRSSEKGKDFSFVTDEDKNEARAYTQGVRAFEKWMGLEQVKSRAVLFGEFAQEHLDRKLARSDEDFSPNSKRTSKNAIRHLIKAFGFLRLDQVIEEPWEDYVSGELSVKKQKFFNRRKELSEILRRAHRLGVIKRLPEFRNPDPKAEAGQYLPDELVRRILRSAGPDTWLLVQIVWKQGGRPSEVLQYEWDMINWRDGPTGSISIPVAVTKTRRARTIPLNSEVSRLLKERLKTSKSRYVFPSPDGKRGAECRIEDYSSGWDGALNRSVKRLVLAEARAWKSDRREAAGLLAGLRKVAEKAVLYDLRRTFITNQAEAGRDIVFVAKYLDTSISMIEGIYLKVRQGKLREVAG